MQSVMPKEEMHTRVAWAMRPKPRKPAIRIGESGLVLSWGLVKKNGAKKVFTKTGKNKEWAYAPDAGVAASISSTLCNMGLEQRVRANRMKTAPGRL
jgi:hypothetical protein